MLNASPSAGSGPGDQTSVVADVSFADVRRGLRGVWAAFILRRLMALIAILVGLLLATFAMVRLIPGDPAREIGGLTATARDIATINQQLGLDRPLFDQLEKYVSGVLSGDLGESFTTREPVATTIRNRFGDSLSLAGAALLLVFLVGIPAGMLGGALARDGRHPRSDLAFTSTTAIVGSLPEYLMGTVLAFIFAVWLRVLPVAGSEGLDALILPALAVALRPAAMLMRIVRLETLNVFAQDYMRTARSKRLPARIMYLRHALPNVLTAALTIGGLLFASLIGGAVVVENVFNRPGVGTALVNGVLARDYPVVQGCVLFLGVTVVVVNAVVDFALATIDPRTLTGRS